MDPNVIPLYYLSSLAGLVMVVGGIWLIYREKIYIDSESKQVTEIELPIGKFKTNIPALALFVLGFFPLIYPLAECAEMRSQLHLRGSVEGDLFPIQVYAVVRSEPLLGPGDFNLSVPFLEGMNQDYKLLYVVPGQPVMDYRPDFQQARKGELRVPPKELWRYKANDLEPVPPEFR